MNRSASLLALLLAGGCSQKEERPSVLLVTLDTTRADRLSCYGYFKPTSPALDRLAADSVLYTRATSTSSWTLPSHASLFTGKLTTSHGARYDPEGPLRLTDAIAGPPAWKQYRARGLSPEERTLARILKDAGYATGAVVGGPWMKRAFGLHRGFDYYDDDQIGEVNGRLAAQVTTAGVSWVERTGGRPFFLFLNYYDPHAPYAPPDESSGEQEPSALYDAEIRYMDRHLGRLLDRLKELGLYDRALILVTADHGELLGEHGQMGHGNFLYQEELHVPLLVKYPRGEEPARRDDAPVQTIDILPLILVRLGLTAPPGIQGGLPAAPGHPVVAEVYPLEFSSPDGHWRALFDPGLQYKFLWNSKGNHQLFHLREDDREQFNLIAREPERARRMESALDRYLASLPKPGAPGPATELDEETLRALRSLGYVK